MPPAALTQPGQGFPEGQPPIVGQPGQNVPVLTRAEVDEDAVGDAEAGLAVLSEGRMVFAPPARARSGAEVALDLFSQVNRALEVVVVNWVKVRQILR